MSAQLYHLSNGTRVAIDVVPYSEIAHVGLYFTVGSRVEESRNNGVAHFLEHMLFHGTDKRTSQQVVKDIEQRGGATNASTSQETTSYYITGRSKHIETFIDILGDMACNAIIPSKIVKNERRIILEESRARNDDDEVLASDTVESLMYRNQSLGRDILGPRINIATMTRGMLKSFKDRHYHAGNLVAVVAGNVNPDEVLAAFEKTIGRLPARPPTTFVRAVAGSGYKCIERDSEQIHLAIRFNAYAEKDPRSLYAELGADILGEGFSSRLFQGVREKYGLVYGVSAANRAMYDTGGVDIEAATSPRRTGMLLRAVCNEVCRIRDQGITSDELEKVKETQLTALAGSKLDMEDRADQIFSDLQYQGQLQSIDEKMAKTEAVTLADVNKALRDIFSQKPAIVAVGPCKYMEPYSKILQRLKL